MPPIGLVSGFVHDRDRAVTFDETTLALPLRSRGGNDREARR